MNRGCAHVGMIKAMIEANIPIDIIGGTSIGSFMGALWAEENNYDKFFERSRSWATQVSYFFKFFIIINFIINFFDCRKWTLGTIGSKYWT